MVPDKGAIGKKFRKEAKQLLEWLAGLSREEVVELEEKLKNSRCVWGWGGGACVLVGCACVGGVCMCGGCVHGHNVHCAV